MTAHIIPLHPTPAPDPGPSLEVLQRGWLAIEAELSPWSDSTLIAVMVHTTDPIERGKLIREIAREGK